MSAIERRAVLASGACGMLAAMAGVAPAAALPAPGDPVLSLAERQRELIRETVEADRRMMDLAPGPGREEARKAFDQAEEAWQEIEEDIADTPAASLAGILAKLRIVAEARVFETGSALERMLDGAVADLDRLATA